MAHRLRLYFGAGRSNTAPELEVFERDSGEERQCQRQQLEEATDRTVLFRVQTPPVSGSPREHSAQPFPFPGLSGTGPWASEPALKRSSSMFIPQLAHMAEPKTTKSSTMQISLQCSSRPGGKALNGYADDLPPRYSPPGPAPAYTEPAELRDYPCAPPPPYNSPDVLGSNPAERDPPQRRVFSIGSHGHTGGSNNLGQAGIGIGRICIQRYSPDGTEVQQFRILPYGGDNGGSLGWFVQQQSLDRAAAVNGGTQRLVFQLQQNQSQDLNQAGQRAASAQEKCTNLGFANSGDGRVLRYPRIRLERASLQQRPPVENAQKSSGTDGQGEEENSVLPETQRTEPEDRSLCIFKIRRETPRRQPHFRICFSPNGSRGQNINFDHDFTQNNPKVNIYMETKGDSLCFVFSVHG